MVSSSIGVRRYWLRLCSTELLILLLDGSMSKKYAPLGEFLENSDSNSLALSFDQIERMIDGLLPMSAKKYVVWWSNSPVEGRQNEVWLRRGWTTTDVNLKSRTVKFTRNAVSMSRAKSVSSKSNHGLMARKAPAAILEAAPVAAAHGIELHFEWQMLGLVVLDTNGTVVFPNVASCAGLYRLRLDQVGRSQIYIGESVNLRRRFGNYRNPGPTQQTSRRINALLKEWLGTGAIIAVDIVNSGVKLCVNGAPVSADLTDKAVRRMIEHAAIVSTDGSDIEIANR